MTACGDDVEFPPDPDTLLHIEFFESREHRSASDHPLRCEWSPKTERALQEVTPRQRVVYMLSKSSDMEREDIAELLGTTATAIGSDVHRAKAVLERALARSGEASEPTGCDVSSVNLVYMGHG